MKTPVPGTRLHVSNLERQFSGAFGLSQLLEASTLQVLIYKFTLSLTRLAWGALDALLQVFKTKNRGWGVRSHDTIPPGAFVCTYTGELITNVRATQALPLYLLCWTHEEMFEMNDI